MSPPCETMDHAEKTFVIFYWTYIVLYLVCFFSLAATGRMEHCFFYVLPFHFLGMFLGIPLLVIVIRDLYKRDFPNPNTKVTWAILMLLLWPSILVYLCKHGFRPRPGCSLGDAFDAGSAFPANATTLDDGNPYRSPPT